MTPAQENEISILVNASLDRAEKKWQEGGSELVAANEHLIFDSMIEKSESTESVIPGHPIVNDDEAKVDEFIALVADMRDSTTHLMCASSPKNTNVSDLQRVFYETSALLPALAKTISYEGGSVTEYLGDGVLAFFKVDPENKSESIYAAHRAARDIVNKMRKILNATLQERYRLPDLDLGVGLAYSKALITMIGLDGEKQAKAFGECVFRATKLSSGRNVIYTDKNLEAMWPTSKGGGLRFTPKNIDGVYGYLLGTSN